MFKPLLPYPSHIDLLARFSNLPVTMANNQTIESMPNNLAIAVKLNGDMREDWYVLTVAISSWISFKMSLENRIA